jgi:glycosyltransferase involved in cell wall biosynthesis
MSRPTLTAAIIARDEELLIGECLDSLDWADERLVVLDTGTSDRTRDVAEARGARVVDNAFVNFARQRDRALELATTDWVLFVDADERVRGDLRAEIEALLTAPEAHVGYWIPRDNVIFGKVVRGAGWSPDYQLRLLKRSAAHFDPERIVHEVALLDGTAGYLRSRFLHLNYRTRAEFVAKQERYGRLDAERWLATFGRPRLRALVGQPLREFWRRFVSLAGYRDGLLGLELSLRLAAYQARVVRLARRLG